MVAPAGVEGKGSAPWGGAPLGPGELAPGSAPAPPRRAWGCYQQGTRWPRVLPRGEPRPSGAARGFRKLKEEVQPHSSSKTDSLRHAWPTGGEGG